MYRVYQKKYCLLKMVTKENVIAIDCTHVLRALNIKFNDQLMTRVKGIKNIINVKFNSILKIIKL